MPFEPPRVNNSALRLIPNMHLRIITISPTSKSSEKIMVGESHLY